MVLQLLGLERGGVALLRSILPLLLLLGLLGMRSSRAGARRLTVLAATVLLAFGAVEMLMNLVGLLFNTPRASLIPGTLLGIFQNALHGYATLIILVAVLTRPQVKAILP